jgi:wobble nucleotide-excising tRNase
MLKKINQIKDFGVFHNFGGAALPEFRQFNLIFGWNYSGKTTLSRVFQCLEYSNHHPDYSAAKFSLRDTADQDFDEKFGHACNVRVFNEDFRAQNLKWGVDDGINPILFWVRKT